MSYVFERKTVKFLEVEIPSLQKFHNTGKTSFKRYLGNASLKMDPSN